MPIHYFREWQACFYPQEQLTYNILTKALILALILLVVSHVQISEERCETTKWYSLLNYCRLSKVTGRQSIAMSICFFLANDSFGKCCAIFVLQNITDVLF